MDLDVFVSAHRAEWDRLDALLRRQRRLTGAEADELVVLDTPRWFSAVGQFYDDFDQTSDAEVIACLAGRRGPTPT